MVDTLRADGALRILARNKPKEKRPEGRLC